jgi:trigger factor
MTTKWEKTEANVGVLEVEVASDRFTEALDFAFKKVVQKVNVPGFRKGRVPRKMFESRFGVESLYQDAVDYLLPQAYEAAITEAGIDPVDRPSVDVVQVEVGKPFIFKATVTVKPEVELGKYKGLKVEDKSFEVTDETVNEELENIRKSHAEIDVVEDGEVENGDNVNIDFAGTVDGEAFEGGEAENYQLEIGSGMFIAGFEEQLVGMKSGEERDIKVTFPEEYHVKTLASKDAVFHVKLHDMKRKSLRELTDDFVQEISEFQTVDEYVADLKNQLTSRKEQEHERYIEDEVIQTVVKACKVEIPQVMIDHEADHLVENFAQQLQMQQIPFDSYLEFTGMTREELRSQFSESAEKSVRTGLVMDAIAQVEKLDASDDDVSEELKKIAESASLEVDRVQQMLGMRDPGLQSLKGDIRTRKTVAFLVGNSKVG